MRSLPGFALATAVAGVLLVAGCANTKAQAALPDASPLMIPQAPARVVIPPAPDPPPQVVETPPAASTTTSANPPANPSRPNRDPKPAPPVTPPPAAPPAAQPAAPTTPLETQGNQSELEQKTRGLLGSAKGALQKINYASLNADGKSQWDAAQRFVKQADDALNAKNYVYAWQLADKANTIATLLLRHS
jgi:hypothetical protein